MAKFEFNHGRGHKQWDKFGAFHNYVQNRGGGTKYMGSSYEGTNIVLFENGEVMVTESYQTPRTRGVFTHVDAEIILGRHLKTKDLYTKEGEKVLPTWLCRGGAQELLVDHRNGRVYAIEQKNWTLTHERAEAGRKDKPDHLKSGVAWLSNKNGEWESPFSVILNRPQVVNKEYEQFKTELSNMCTKYLLVSGQQLGTWIVWDNRRGFLDNKIRKFFEAGMDLHAVFTRLPGDEKEQVSRGIIRGRKFEEHPYLEYRR